MTKFSLNELDAIIADRAIDGSGSSYTASLLEAGTAKCARKLGEEAVETVIAAMSADPDGLRKESADLLYHLLVLLKSADVSLEEVMAELQTRTARSGLEEKASRNKP